MCDGQTDCEDGSDEHSCGEYSVDKMIPSQTMHTFAHIWLHKPNNKPNQTINTQLAFIDREIIQSFEARKGKFIYVADFNNKCSLKVH